MTNKQYLDLCSFQERLKREILDTPIELQWGKYVISVCHDTIKYFLYKQANSAITFMKEDRCYTNNQDEARYFAMSSIKEAKWFDGTKVVYVCDEVCSIDAPFPPTWDKVEITRCEWTA